ncbi:MAG: AI-2E family transporter [Bacilli bacterium]|nr:AI-2E family transporter [Bacilli bacterium]
MFKNRVNYKLLNILILCGIMYIGVATIDYWFSLLVRIFNLVFPYILAFIIAYAFSPLVRLLQRKGVNKKLSVLIVVLGVLGVIVGLVGLTVPLIYEQLLNLTENTKTIIGDLSSKFDIDITPYQSEINEFLNGMISWFGNYIQTGFVSFVSHTANLLGKIIIVTVVTIYFLIDMDHIRKTLKEYLLVRNKKAFKLLKDIDNELGHYLEGLTIFMVIQFFEYSFLFWLVGHPNWLLLGLLASFTTVIPYFGGWITNIIAVILASVISTKLFIATLIICLIFPNIDGYFISPHVYGKTNNVKPLWSIFAVVVMGGLFNIFGILIALPTFLVVSCVYKFIKEENLIKYRERKEKEKNKKRED